MSFWHFESVINTINTFFTVQMCCGFLENAWVVSFLLFTYDIHYFIHFPKPFISFRVSGIAAYPGDQVTAPHRAHTLSSHTLWGQFRVTNQTVVWVFLLWEEIWALRSSPCHHWESMLTSHRKLPPPIQGLILGPSHSLLLHHCLVSISGPWCTSVSTHVTS